ncbi:MAG TPA: hypothetical protein VK438_13755 [Xanthobacteraceae bacterium]|nr:hypothetical protein [Xanthobacteraceae bacterium]
MPTPIPMPSLFRYFAFVGAALLGVLSLVNFLLDPSTGATPVASAPQKPALAVQHDPRASKVERWRDEQAALQAAQQTQTSVNASLVAKSTAEPATPAATTAAPAKGAPQVAPVATQPAKAEPAAAPPTETSAIFGVETPEEIAAARAAQAVERKARLTSKLTTRLAKAKARKERLARARATPREHFASNQQDQFYYGQRGGQPSFGAPYSAFAPQPSYGPFGWGR